MDITFERGDPLNVKGHALVYFRTYSDPDKVYATYIIVLPISVDFAKYVPPFLVSHLGGMPLSDFSAFSLPPMPEEVGSYQELQRLAEMREDDLVYAGNIHSSDLPEVMQVVADVVRQYAQLWADYTKPAITADAEEEGDGSRVNEVLYSLLNVQDKLAELSKLVGKLRFAAEGNDREMGAEMEAEISVLGRYLPEHYYIPRILQAAMDSSARGTQLAQLYLERAYKLSHGDDAAAHDLEAQIDALMASG
jgi:hypothetical protein